MWGTPPTLGERYKGRSGGEGLVSLLVVLVVEGICSYRRTALWWCEEGSERVVWECSSGECAQKSRRRSGDVCALSIRYARAKVERPASCGCGAHRAEVGCEACQLVSCSWGEGIDGTRGLHDQQWCWV